MWLSCLSLFQGSQIHVKAFELLTISHGQLLHGEFENLPILFYNLLYVELKANDPSTYLS